MKNRMKVTIKPMPPSSGFWDIKPDGTVTFSRKLPKGFLEKAVRELGFDND